MEKYDEIFIADLKLNKEELETNPSRESLRQWDSLAHLTLVADIEDAYGIMLDPEDIMKFDSYEHGKEIVHKYC